MPCTVASLEVPSVNRNEVLRYLGYRGQELTPEMEARLAQVTARGLELARPRACLRAFEVKDRVVNDDGVPEVRLADCALILPGKSIAEHLDGAVSVGIMAVTLGAEVDRELRRLSLTDALEQVLFDAVCTAIVERAADSAEALLVADAAQRGLYTNWRFSPGYGDLPLSCQPALLAVLDATRRLGLTLTPSLLMVPTKSVTAVLGYFHEPREGTRSDCGTCNLREFCTIRRKGMTCRG